MLPWPNAVRPQRRSPARALPLSAVLLATSLLLAAFASPEMAQVQMNCVAVPVPSAYPGDWRSTHSLCLLTMTNFAGEPIRCDLRVQMDQTGGSAAAVEPGRVFGPGQTVLVTQNIINWDRLRFSGQVQDAMDRTGHLPARPVTINLFCENMVGVNSGNQIPDAQIQITIVPSVPAPPTLQIPPDASQVRSPAPVFTWSPVRMTTGQEVWYQFRLVKVLPGQSAARALDSNDPVIETFVHQSTLAYPSAAPRLEDGAFYAWRVQALLNASTSPNDAPIAGQFTNVGLNEGKSQVYSFAWYRPDAPIAAGALMRRAGDARAAATDQPGGLLGGGTDERTAPVTKAADLQPTPLPRIKSPTDSLAFAMLAPRRHFWGPSSGGRSEVLAPTLPVLDASTTGNATTTTGTNGTSDDSGMPAGEASPGMEPSGVVTASHRPPRAPIQTEAVPEGAGVATKWLRVAGTSVAAGELYGRKGAGEPSRPDENGQLVAGLTLSTLGDRVKIPVQALVSGDQVSFRQTINSLAVHPEWHWGGIHAGTVRPNYSRFSLQDASVFGGGADLVRENWYVGAVAGQMRKSIRGDTLNAIEAQFERNVIAGRFGFGSPLGNAVELVVMRASDDKGSLPANDSLVRVAPTGNTVVEARARRLLRDTTVTVQLDAALSQFDRNLNSDQPAVTGGAVGARVERRTWRSELGLALDYSGGGFLTLGNSELAPDRMEGRINGRRMLSDGKLRLGGSLGYRKDDISGTLGGATRRKALGVQAGWQPGSRFGTDFDFGLLSSEQPGTELRAALSDRSTAFSLSPRLLWNWRGTQQALNATLAVQSLEFSDVDAAGFANSRTTTVVAGWQSNVSRNWLFNLSGNYVRSKVAGLVTEVGAFGPGVAMSLFNGRAQGNLQLLVTETSMPGLGTDRELTPNIDARYLVNGRQALVFRAGWRRYRMGATEFGDFDEHLITLQYSASL